ncbi:MAG: rRNA maturation RNase YbeY [Candidatus Omnitrophota bacterium]
MKSPERIAVRNDQRHVAIRSGNVRRLAERALASFRLEGDIHLNILFVDDLKMSALHERYMGRRGPTDVLAFGMQEGRRLRGDVSLLGDIVISAETALRQAKRFHSNVRRELALYVIHGILHLLGYDDRNRADRLKMRRQEKELLALCKNEV